MDLTRNVEAEFDPERARFDAAAPGWRQAIDPAKLAKRALREALFDYWCGLVEGLGFKFSQRMPLIRDESNRPLYRLVFFSRSEFPNRCWDDIAQGPIRDLFE